MRKECVQAVELAAQKIGKTVTTADLRNIEEKIYSARKQLALKDNAAYVAMSRDEQLAKAGEMVVQDAIHNAILKRRRAEQTIIKAAEKEAVLNKMKASGLDDMAALNRYTMNIEDGTGQIKTMESYIKGLTSDALRKIPSFYKLMEESSFAGVQVSDKRMKAFIEESYGRNSGDALARKAWQEVEMVRKEQMDHFNRLGGDVAPLANYRNPQALDAYKIHRRGGGKNGDVFIADYMQWVDRDMYVNADGTRMTDDQMKTFLKEAYITLKTDGASKPVPKAGEGTGSIANRMKAHRQLHLKSPEAYIAAMDKYGAGSVFDQVRGQFEGMAHNIALTNKFGPNADHSFRQSYQRAAKATNSTDATLLSAFESLSGQRTTRNVVVAHAFGEAKAAMVASRLGSMLLAQLSDIHTAKAVATSMNVPVSELMGWAKDLATSREGREILALHGLGLDSALNNISRFAGDIGTTGIFGRFASAIPTIQGANFWTKVWRQATGAMLESKLANMTAKYDWDTLPAGDRAGYESMGVTKEDWAIWKLAAPSTYKTHKLLGPDSIDRIPVDEIIKVMPMTKAAAQVARQEAAINLQSFTVQMSHMAVLQPSALSQAWMSGSAERGAVDSEIWKFITQFKAFPVAYTRQVLMERAVNHTTKDNPWVYRAKMLTGATMLGGLSLILGDLANGKDPREITPDFAWQALLKGGGLGYFADIAELVKDTAESPFKALGILGPVMGYAAGSIVPAVGYGAKALVTQDEKDIEKFTKFSYDSIKGITPGQNLWFIKGFLHNVLLDDLQEAANPGYKERQIKRATEAGTQYWLGMGQDTRSPNFGNMVGQEVAP